MRDRLIHDVQATTALWRHATFGWRINRCGTHFFHALNILKIMFVPCPYHFTSNSRSRHSLLRLNQPQTLRSSKVSLPPCLIFITGSCPPPLTLLRKGWADISAWHLVMSVCSMSGSKLISVAWLGHPRKNDQFLSHECKNTFYVWI